MAIKTNSSIEAEHLKTIRELQESNQRLQNRAKELESNTVWLSLLSGISWTITSNLTVKEILQQIVFFTSELLQTEICVIRLLEGDSILLGAQVGIPRDMVFDRLPKNEGIAAWILQEKKPLRIDDIKTHPINREYFQKYTPRFNFSSYLGAPLLVRDKLIGIIGVYSKSPRHFTEMEMEHLAVVANHAAIAIDNALSFNAVHHAKKELEATFDAIPDLIYIIDKDFNIIRVNRAVTEKIGLPFQQTIGKKCYEIFHRTSQPPEYCLHRKSMDTKESAVMELEIPHWNGIFLISYLPVKDNDHNLTSAVHVARDITEQKQMQQHLLQSEKLVALGQLVSGVAHELNNPLTGVLGYSELLLHRKTDPEIHSAAEKIFKESKRTAKIVQNLLSFSRHYKPEKKYMNIHQVLDDTISLREYELRVNHISICREYAANLPKTMFDPHQMQQVFLNIIINAESALADNPARTSGTGKDTITIHTTFDIPSNRIQIEIKDNGPGMSPENLTRIFNPFFTTKDIGRGTGLGLSIAYGIVKEHSGDIYARSELGHGATFIIELPVIQFEQKKSDTKRVERKPNRKLESVAVKKILIVDDEPSIIAFLEEALGDQGHTLDSASDGTIALQKIMNDYYDVIFCDIKMPGLDGKMLFRKLQEENPHLVSNLVFMTGDVVNPETVSFLQQTGVGYLEKPFTVKAVLTAVSRLLKKG